LFRYPIAVPWEVNDQLHEIPHVRITETANPTPNPRPAKRNRTISIDVFFD